MKKYLFLFYDHTNTLKDWFCGWCFASTSESEVTANAVAMCHDRGCSNVCVFRSSDFGSSDDLLIADIDLDDG